MLSLTEIISSNSFLQEHLEDSIFVLRRLSCAYSELNEENSPEVIARISFKTGFSKEFINTVLAAFPEKTVEDKIFKRIGQIKKMHRNIVSKRMNKEFSVLFADMKPNNSFNPNETYFLYPDSKRIQENLNSYWNVKVS